MSPQRLLSIIRPHGLFLLRHKLAFISQTAPVKGLLGQRSVGLFKLLSWQPGEQASITEFEDVPVERISWVSSVVSGEKTYFLIHNGQRHGVFEFTKSKLRHVCYLSATSRSVCIWDDQLCSLSYDIGGQLLLEYIDPTTGNILSRALAGRGAIKRSDLLSTIPSGIVVSTGERLLLCRPESESMEEIIAGEISHGCLAIGDDLYFVKEWRKVFHMNLATRKIELVSEEPNRVHFIGASGAGPFWWCGDDQQAEVRRASGTHVETVHTIPGSFHPPILVDDSLYWMSYPKNEGQIGILMGLKVAMSGQHRDQRENFA